MKILKILNRFYVKDIEQSISFYEALLREPCGSRFTYSQKGLELARIGNLLLIGGTDEALKPFRDTQATFLVDSVSEFREFLINSGSEILRDIQEVPTGKNMTAKHADGTVIEYVEHK